MNSVSKITLSQLKKGDKAIVKTIDTERIPLKLIELGCLPGSEVQMIQKAPFGDPIYIHINDSFLSIREEMASLIEIEKIDE